MYLLPMWMKGLTPELVRRAEIELGETPISKEKCLQELKALIADERELYPLMEDAFLIRFLRARKYNVKKAFKTLKNYYEYKYRYSGFMTDLRPSQLSRIIDMDKVFISPKRDLKGGGIMIMFIGSFDFEQATPWDMLATTFLCAEIGMETEASQVAGSSLIFDFQGITLNKLRHLSSFSFLASAVKGIQDCWPYRMNAFHVVFEPMCFNILYSVIRPMLSRKIRERVHLHGSNLETLHTFIPPESLPKQLGGDLVQKDFEDYRSIIYSKESFMEKLNKYVYYGRFPKETSEK